MDPMIVTFVVLALVIVGFVTGRVPLVIVALFAPVALWATGVATLEQAFAGFSDPVVLFIAALFVWSEALDASGVTAWLGGRISSRPRLTRTTLVVLIGSVAALAAAIVSINGAVAALLPVVVVVAARAGIVASKLLIPLAFAASAGSMLTLTGTPVNIIVSEAAADAGGREFGYFEYALVGLPLVAGTVLVLVALGDRLLPAREPQRIDRAAPDADVVARAWKESYGEGPGLEHPFESGHGVAEVVIAPRSTLIGRTVCPGMTTRDENLVVLALGRGRDRQTIAEASAGGGITLRAGDSVLVGGPWDALHRYTASRDVVPVESTRDLQRAVPLGRGWKRTVTIIALSVLALATGLVPPLIVGIVAAAALVLTGVVTVPQALRSISWETVLLVAAMIPLSGAIIRSGAADLIAEGVRTIAGDSSPHLALLVLCLATLALGQWISNVATVLVMAPVAVALAQMFEVSIQPFMMALAVMGAAAFLTPIATPANVMVMRPAGYTFGDYWRIGLPVALLFLVTAVLYVPLVWPF